MKKVYDNGLLAVCSNSFGVKQGEILGLLGPSGSGKSSTLKMLSMEMPVTDGLASVLDQPLNNINFSIVGRQIGLLSQHNTIIGELTVEENLFFMASIKGLTEKEFINNKKCIL